MRRGEKISDTEVQRRVITVAKRDRNARGLVRSRRWRWSGMPGRAAGVPELVRFAAGPPPGAEGRAPPVPPQARPAVNPADPQRVRHARRQAVRGQGRGHHGRVVQGPAVGAVVGDGDPRAGRPVLRLVRGGARGHPASSLRPGDRHRSGPDQPGRHLRRRGDRQPAVHAGEGTQLARAQRGCPASRKAPRTGPEPGTGSRSCTARCGKPGWITRTRRRCGWSATTKRSTPKTLPSPG